jgi:hypothetical protein
MADEYYVATTASTVGPFTNARVNGSSHLPKNRQNPAPALFLLIELRLPF